MNSLDLLVNAVARRLGARPFADITLGQLFDRWIGEHASVRYKPQTVANCQRFFYRHLYWWQNVRLADIRRATVRAWLARLADNSGPVTARRARKLIGLLFASAERWGLVPEGFSPVSPNHRYVWHYVKFRPHT